MKKPLINIILSSLIILSYTPISSAQTNSIGFYIEEGLKNNLVLNQKNISWEKAMIGLQSAKSFYLPTIGFQTTYSTADGGRNIPLPLGDLLNGVYTTLNDLTQSQRFVELENTEINFFPKNYYDAKIRTTVPILNSDIRYGVKISEQQIVLKEYELEIYKQELIKNIKTAYYNYLSAMQVVDIYKSSQALAEEGKRVNEKLYESGKGLPVYIMRSESEIAQINADLSKSKQQTENAKLYFNSLLNRSPESNIDIGSENDTVLVDAEGLLLEEVNINSRCSTGRSIISSSEGKSILLKDIAQVYADYAPDNHITRLNGYRSLFINAAMKKGQNITEVQKEYLPVIDQYKAELPSNMDLVMNFNQANNVNDRLGGLGIDFLIAVTLVIFTLLPLGNRASAVVMIA